MPFVRAEGVTLHYRIDGDDRLPLLVLSNGLGTELSMWSLQIPFLTGTFRVLRYDARGHGESSVPATAFSIEHLGRDVLALLDALDVARAHFCGLSMGGMTGMWLAVHARDRLQSVVLANTAARIGPPAMWNDRIDVVNAVGMRAVSDAAVARWFTPDFIARKPGIVADVKGAMERTSAEGYVRCCAAIRDTDFRNDIAKIEAPVLVISGAHDVATTPADGCFVAQQIAGSRLLTLNAAHLSNIESPHDFNQALHDFCLQNETADSARPA